MLGVIRPAEPLEGTGDYLRRFEDEIQRRHVQNTEQSCQNATIGRLKGSKSMFSMINCIGLLNAPLQNA